jgi:hypothetical protein
MFGLALVHFELVMAWPYQEVLNLRRGGAKTLQSSFVLFKVLNSFIRELVYRYLNFHLFLELLLAIDHLTLGSAFLNPTVNMFRKHI